VPAATAKQTVQKKGKKQMSNFKVYTIESAPEAARPALQKLKDSVGLIPNLAGAMAESPTLIEAFVTLRGIFQNGSFSPIEREVISITNAVANRCRYCVAAHSLFAQKAYIPPDVLESLRAGQSPNDPRLKALSDFARKMTTTRGQFSEADLQGFLAAGYTQAQAMEVIVGVAVSVLANYANHLADVPLDEFLQPLAWKASA
jgi:uncharacterized peroxidase-related enzyme